MPSHAAIPHRSPTVQVNIKNLVDDVQCYQTVRELRWPDGIPCPSCESKQVIKRGFDDTEPARQRYECHDCDRRFDDLTDAIFAGHHQPLKVRAFNMVILGLKVWPSRRDVRSDMACDLVAFSWDREDASDISPSLLRCSTPAMRWQTPGRRGHETMPSAGPEWQSSSHHKCD